MNVKHICMNTHTTFVSSPLCFRVWSIQHFSSVLFWVACFLYTHHLLWDMWEIYVSEYSFKLQMKSRMSSFICSTTKVSPSFIYVFIFLFYFFFISACRWSWRSCHACVEELKDHPLNRVCITWLWHFSRASGSSAIVSKWAQVSV